jgi:hypothetical protein
MDPMMMLVVGWTLVGGFVFTVIVTCLSLVGWIRFADKSQQKKLFLVLIVELVLGVGAKALGKVTLNATGVENAIADEGKKAGRTEGALDVTRTLLEPGAAPLQREQLTAIVDRLQPTPGVLTSQEIDNFKARVQSLPTGAVNPGDAAAIQDTTVMQRVPRMRDVRMLPQ